MTAGASGQYAAVDPPTLHERIESLERTVCHLSERIGHSPDPATGTQGAGLCRVVAELATASHAQNRRVIGGATVGAAGMVGAIEAILAVLRMFHG